MVIGLPTSIARVLGFTVHVDVHHVDAALSFGLRSVLLICTVADHGKEGCDPCISSHWDP